VKPGVRPGSTRIGLILCVLETTLVTTTAAAQAPDLPAAPITAEEEQLLKRGEIPSGEHLGGSLLGAVVGFGIGQAIQGRWVERGWLFTLGEGAAMVALAWGGTRIATHCPAGEASGCGDRGVGLAMGGGLALAGLRIWSTLDALIVPTLYNRRLAELRNRAGSRTPAAEPVVVPYLAPPSRGKGLTAGLSLAF
jgi:hypothetical protein